MADLTSGKGAMPWERMNRIRERTQGPDAYHRPESGAEKQEAPRTLAEKLKDAAERRRDPRIGS